MGLVYLQSRLEALVKTQNADGGWGYFPGRKSWMEPTAYAVLALSGVIGAEQSARKGWDCIRSWQAADGGWRPSDQVQDSSWVTSLGLIVGSVWGLDAEPRKRATDWLMRVSGQESRLAVRLASMFHMLKTDVNVSHKGWPWWPGNSAWIEPTALAILALRKANGSKLPSDVAQRVHEGEELILSRRGRDGGWNSGNPSVLKVDVPSYPETTAIALIGLQGRDKTQLSSPLESARSFFKDTRSSYAKAWLNIAFRCMGAPAEDPNESEAPSDILLCALQALGHSGGSFRLLRPEVLA